MKLNTGPSFSACSAYVGTDRIGLLSHIAVIGTIG